MPRILPWRNACPPLVVQRLHQLAASRLLLIHEKGPTSFVLKDANSSKKFTVGLGDVHSCTCSESRAEMCTHILYVLQKVFRIPAANPLLWQRSFMDAEVHDLVLARNRMRNLYRQQQLQIQRDQRMRRLAQGDGDDDDDGHDDENSPTSSSRDRKKPSKRNNPGVVERKVLDADDSCPICCDAFNERDQQASRSAGVASAAPSSSGESLVWCRFGCGNSIHVECFRQYCQHHATRPEPLACPLCRAKWGQLDAGDFGGDLPKHATGTKCDACKADITYGERFRCCFCPRFDLCPQCYNTRPNVHAQHPFDIQSGPGARFLPAPPRPLPPTNQQFRNNNATAVASMAPPPHLSAAALLSAGVTIGEIFQQHSPNSRRSNENNNNNNNRGNSDASPSAGSFVLTMNEALRFSLPFDTAMEEYISKYFGVRLSVTSNNSDDDHDGQSIVDSASSETAEERNLMMFEKENFKRNVSCPICLENFIEIDEGDENESEKHAEKLILLPTCKHIFHLTCGTQWLSHGGASCAFCKLPVSTLMLPIVDEHHNRHHHSISASAATPSTPQRHQIHNNANNNNNQSHQQQQQPRNQVRAQSLHRHHTSTPLTSVTATPNLMVIGGSGGIRGTTPSNNDNRTTTTIMTTPRIDGEYVVFPSPPNISQQQQQQQQQALIVRRGRPAMAPAPKFSSSSRASAQPGGSNNINNSNHNNFNDFVGVVGLNANANNALESGTDGTQQSHHLPSHRSNSTTVGRRTSLNANINISSNRPQNNNSSNNNNNSPSPVLSLDGILTTVGGGRTNNSDVQIQQHQQSKPPPKSTAAFRLTGNNNRESKSNANPPPPPSFSVAGKGGFTFFPTIANNSQN